MANILNRQAVHAALLSAWRVAHAGNVSPKTRVSAEAIDAVEAAAHAAVRKIARSAYGPGVTIKP